MQAGVDEFLLINIGGTKSFIQAQYPAAEE
jgi:hypothetical protein